MDRALCRELMKTVYPEGIGSSGEGEDDISSTVDVEVACLCLN